MILGLTKKGYATLLGNWLKLSIDQNVPVSLLILSRAFTLEMKEKKPEEVLFYLFLLFFGFG